MTLGQPDQKFGITKERVRQNYQVLHLFRESRCDFYHATVSGADMTLIRVVEKFDYGRGNKFSTHATWVVWKCLEGHIFRKMNYLKLTGPLLQNAPPHCHRMLRPVGEDSEKGEKKEPPELLISESLGEKGSTLHFFGKGVAYERPAFSR